MAVSDKPAAEVEVTAELVAALLGEQHPDLADLPLGEFANGWDNVIFRLGDDLAVRVPRRQLSARLVEHEQIALPIVAPRLPLRVPAPVRSGRPSPALRYPWAWSIVPWLDGRIVAGVDLADPTREATRLGGFLAALHQDAPADAPPNPYRGQYIGDNTAVNEERTTSLDRGDELLARWHELVDDVARWPHPPVWLHGDLHPANVLADDRGSGTEISAVIDWGDVCAGDPATDLSIAWALFDRADRAALRDAASQRGFGIDDDTWRRAEAWALHFAIVYRLHSADDPTMAGIADRLITRLFGD